VLIREATDSDWAGIWPIWRAIAQARDTIPWAPSTTSAEAREYWLGLSPGHVYTALSDEGAVVGSAQLRPNYGRASRIANATYIVDPALAGRGIGRRLVQHTLDVAAAEGYRAMVFNAVVSTNVGAVHLYQSMGFTILATVPEGFDHPEAGPVGLHIMYRKL
jgi:ribosomal protein S18 acetylase RimI-like enzyme